MEECVLLLGYLGSFCCLLPGLIGKGVSGLPFSISASEARRSGVADSTCTFGTFPSDDQQFATSLPSEDSQSPQLLRLKTFEPIFFFLSGFLVLFHFHPMQLQDSASLLSIKRRYKI